MFWNHISVYVKLCHEVLMIYTSGGIADVQTNRRFNFDSDASSAFPCSVCLFGFKVRWRVNWRQMWRASVFCGEVGRRRSNCFHCSCLLKWGLAVSTFLSERAYLDLKCASRGFGIVLNFEHKLNINITTGWWKKQLIFNFANLHGLHTWFDLIRQRAGTILGQGKKGNGKWGSG